MPGAGAEGGMNGERRTLPERVSVERRVKPERRDRMRRINTIHFVGIGGSGMSGIAEVLLNLGYRVQGSDLRAGAVTQWLAGLGARVTIGHAAANIAGADVVVASGAVPRDNPEVRAALQARIPVVARAEMLGELMRFRYSIAVAGTHGKTTTTSLIASILSEGGEDPTYVIGGGVLGGAQPAPQGAGGYLLGDGPAGLQTHFQVRRAAAAPLAVTVNLAGVHNVRNALAAIAVATELDIDDQAILRALAGFQGIDRRLQHIGDVLTAVGRVSIVDDYAHHPTEVAVTLEAVRQGYAGRRVLLAFQPHRYTRTRDLIDDFGKALSGADALCVTEVYAAGEAAIPGADGRAICRAVRGRGQLEPLFVEKVEELAQALKDVIRDGDVIVAMGAGNISAVAHALPAALAALLPPGRTA